MSNFNNSTSSQLETQSRLGLLRATRRFLADLQSLSTRIATVQEISVEINRSLNLNQILQVVGQQAKWILDFDHCSICLCNVDGSRQFISLFDVSGQLSQTENGSASPNAVDADAIEQVLQLRQPQLIKDSASQGQVYSNENHHGETLCENSRETASQSSHGHLPHDPPSYGSPSHAPLRSQLIVPLESEGEVLGTINFASRQPQAYTQEDVRISHLLAVQLSAAIRNARRFEEMHQLYSELQQTYAELRKLEGLRDELTHMIVHDLRNPLSSIMVGLEMIDVMQTDTTERQRWIEIAQTASDSMNGMIEDLLNLNKLEVGKFNPALQPTDITSIILYRAESYRAQAEMQHKTLLLRLPEWLPTVMVDASLINRVIDNLVSNALKYTESGGLIEIGAQIEAEELQLYVRDDGQGIPTEYCDRIFDKFVQVTDSTGAALRKGTGLGLAFCRMAIEAHGGKIWVESVNHRGSTFFLRLPLSQDMSAHLASLGSQTAIDATNYPITSR